MSESLPENEATVHLITEDEDLPEICALCASPTPRKQRVQEHYFKRGEPTKQGGHWSGLLGLAELTMSRQERRNSLGSESCVVYLPVCKSCSKKEIKPLRVNFKVKQMYFAVHEGFKNAFDAVPRPYRSTFLSKRQD